MEKAQLLNELREKIASGEVNRAEIIGLVQSSNLPVEEETPELEVEQKGKRHYFTLNKILYGIGATIVVLGIGFFIGQIWNDMGGFGRVAVTLGLGVIITICGSVLLNVRPNKQIGQVFHTIGGVLIPGGAMVLLTEVYKFSSLSIWSLVTTFVILFVFYLALTFIHKREAVMFFAIANGTAAVYFFTIALLDGHALSSLEEYNVYVYLTMVMGLVYIFLAWGLRSSWNQRLAPSLNFLGSGAFLTAAFTKVFESGGIWEVLFFVLALAGAALSVKIRSKGVLAISTLFLIAHIIYITAQYFASSIGWPISLIILGFVVIGLGYSSVKINKRFIARKAKQNPPAA